MTDIEKYYDILGIKPGATEAEVKQAYKDLISVWHPDRFGHNPRLQKQAEEKTKELNAAYREVARHLKEQKEQGNTGKDNSYSNSSNESSKKEDGRLYNVIFNGDILPGFNALQVKQDLCDLFKIEPGSFKGKRIFENKTVIVKAGIGIDEAAQHTVLMNEIGAVCIIVPVNTENKEQDSYKKTQNSYEKQEANRDKDYQNKKTEDTDIVNVRNLGFGLGNFWIIRGFIYGIFFFSVFFIGGVQTEMIPNRGVALISSLFAISNSYGIWKHKLWGLYLTYAYLILVPLFGAVQMATTGSSADIITGTFLIGLSVLWFNYFQNRRDWFNGGSKQKNETSQSPQNKHKQYFSFKDNGNGTITDLRTGLMWTKDANLAGVKTWQGALDYVASMNKGMVNNFGYTNWWLPDINEFKSLLKDRGGAPYVWLTKQGFNDVQSTYYWSSTSSANDTSGAWGVYMGNGVVYAVGKSNYGYYVWPVRSGQ